MPDASCVRGGQKREAEEEAGALPLSYDTVRLLHDDVLALEDKFAKVTRS
jgi:hypothetical protein